MTTIQMSVIINVQQQTELLIINVHSTRTASGRNIELICAESSISYTSILGSCIVLLQSFD